MKRIILICFLPVVVIQLILTRYWFLLEHLEQLDPYETLSHTHYLNLQNWLPDFSLTLTFFYIPLYLALAGSLVACLNKTVHPTLFFLLLLFAYFINVFLDYSNWGLSTGRFLHPDNVTVYLLAAGGFWSSIVSLAFVYLAWIIQWLIKRLHHGTSDF